MDCLRCKEEMIKAKLKGDAVGTVVYLTNKKNGIFENERIVLFHVMYVQNVDMLN